MGSKFLKQGKTAIVVRGRYAGKKVVIIKQFDEGTKERPFPHALVIGVDKYPRKVKAKMTDKQKDRKSNLKPFIKVVNYSHLMPTRYAFELDQLKNVVNVDALKEKSQKKQTVKAVKKVFSDRYTSGKNQWFFTKLRF